MVAAGVVQGFKRVLQIRHVSAPARLVELWLSNNGCWTIKSHLHGAPQICALSFFLKMLIFAPPRRKPIPSGGRQLASSHAQATPSPQAASR
jgi:hypothetical protein